MTDDDPLLEADARALSQACFLSLTRPGAARAEADRVTAAAAARGERRTRLLADAFEANSIMASRWDYAAHLMSRAQRLAEGAARGGWPRAVWLAEAAIARLTIWRPAEVDDHRRRLLAQLDAPGEAQRPAGERLWTFVTLVQMAVHVGDFDAALDHALTAQRLAAGLGDMPRLMAVQSLGYVFLSVGDVEGALAVLADAPALADAVGRRSVSAEGNLLFAYLLAGRTADARRLLDTRPILTLPAAVARSPGLRCMHALLRLHEGDADDAAARLGDDTPWPGPEGLPIDANRAWVRGAIALARGDAAGARAACERYLDAAAAAGWRISPVNRTQLERVISEACERQGDYQASLQALRRSQAACFHWVAESLRARLHALHAEAGPQDDTAHAQRLALVDAAIADARAAPPAPSPSRVIAQVTHEMRNPLNGVLGMTSLLMLSDLDERQRHYLSVAQSSAQMLLALCNDLLDHAKLEAGRFELNPQPTELGALLQEVVDVFEPQLRRKGVALGLGLADDVPESVELDALRVKQLLMNLVGNAAKFTERGRIDLHVRCIAGGDAPRLRFEVDDTGPGLDAATRARLFQPFTQADAAVATRHGGTGLGLALCRQLVTLMRGRIDVDSEPGRGSRFWFELPLAAVAQPA